MRWVKKNFRKFLFFSVFFLFLGTSSLWMSWLFLEIGWKDIVIGLLTISIASVYTSAEKALTLMRTKTIENNEDIVELIAMILPLVFSIIVIGFIDECSCLSAFLSLLAYFLCCRLWWYENRDNENLSENVSTLGGDSSEFK